MEGGRVEERGRKRQPNEAARGRVSWNIPAGQGHGDQTRERERKRGTLYTSVNGRLVVVASSKGQQTTRCGRNSLLFLLKVRASRPTLFFAITRYIASEAK